MCPDEQNNYMEAQGVSQAWQSNPASSECQAVNNKLNPCLELQHRVGVALPCMYLYSTV